MAYEETGRTMRQNEQPWITYELIIETYDEGKKCLNVAHSVEGKNDCTLDIATPLALDRKLTYFRSVALM